MRVEVVAVGTELLLGQIADTNSAWIGDRLAAGGFSSHYHQAVGDNQARIVLALRTALARSDAVIVCGGLGPTPDDITREAIAEVMSAELRTDDSVVDAVRAMFGARGRTMPESNLRQALVPAGATVIPQAVGTAPGLICPLGYKVVYAVPGVPHEMSEMVERAVIPDLRARAAAAGEAGGVIASRVLRTWGMSEARLAEALGGRLAELDGPPGAAGSTGGTTTIAFLASGIEGIKVRITVRAESDAEATARLDEEDAAVRAVLAEEGGDIVFGVDGEGIEDAVARVATARGLTVGLAESLTGGLAGARLVNVPGASRFFRGSIVSYASDVKRDLLGVGDGPVVSDEAARAMALGARKVLGADVGLSITGVAGPEPQDGRPPGTVFIGVAIGDDDCDATEVTVPGDRDRVRQYATITALDHLRRRLDED